MNRTACDGVLDAACVARFWAKLGDYDDNGCRRWGGALFSGKRGGGGQFAGGPRRSSGGRASVLAHRFMWTLLHGPIPEGMDVLHACDVRDCCAWSHLRLGTHAENMQDRSERFVNERGGEGTGNAKLTHAQAREVRRLAQLGTPHAEIAAQFGIHRVTVSNIKRGVWRSFSTQSAV